MFPFETAAVKCEAKTRVGRACSLESVLAGAFYFEYPEKGKNFEQTVLDVLGYARREGLPYRYTQYDGWWYTMTKGDDGGTVEWEPKPSVFPHGLV